MPVSSGHDLEWARLCGGGCEGHGARGSAERVPHVRWRMRLKRSAELRREDLAPVFALIPPLHDEWRRLRFDSAGAVINPTPKSPEPAFALSSGCHRTAGATYRITIETPILEVPEEHRGRSLETGTKRSVTDLRLLVDDLSGVAFALGDHDEMWSAVVRSDRSPRPRVEGTWTVDLSEYVRRESGKDWGCLGWIFGGRGHVEATLDTAALSGAGGRLFQVTGRINRFRVRSRVDLEAQRDTWSVTVDVRLRGRGLGRFVLLFGRRRIRDSFEHMVDAVLGATDSDDPGTALEQLSTAVAEVGGPQRFVHLSLWEEDFDSTLGTK